MDLLISQSLANAGAASHHTHRRVGGGGAKDVIPLTEGGLPPPARGWTPESRAHRSSRVLCEELSICTLCVEAANKFLFILLMFLFLLLR